MPGPRHHIYTYIISNYTKGPPVLPEGLSSQPVKDRPPTYVNSTTSSRTFLNCACASNQLWSCSFHRREGSSGFFRETPISQQLRRCVFFRPPSTASVDCISSLLPLLLGSQNESLGVLCVFRS